jgi:hypothetical protein
MTQESSRHLPLGVVVERVLIVAAIVGIVAVVLVGIL